MQRSLAQSSKSFDVNSGPLSARRMDGLPRCSMTRSNVLMILLDDREVSISIASTSLEQSSIRLKVLNFRLPTIASLIKSMLQVLLMLSCLVNGCLTLAGSLRLPLRFLLSLSSLYTRYTFL